MQQMVIVEPFPLTFGGAAPTYSVSRGTGGGNLIEYDPREVWQDSSAAGTANIDIDLGQAMDWDTICLVNVSAADTATWVITGGAGYGSTVFKASSLLKLPSEDGIIACAPALFASPAVLNSRYIRIGVTPVDGPLPTIGCLVVGRSWKPTFPREQGAGRPLFDSGKRDRLDNGGLATVAGCLVSGFRWTFGDLDVADLRKLQGIMRRCRTTEPFLLIEQPDEGFAEGVHYCTFIDLEPYERRDVSKSRWALTVEDWL